MKVIILVTVLISVAFSAACPAPMACPPGSWLDTTVTPNACKPCLAGCSSCVSATTCNACWTGYTKDVAVTPNTCTVKAASDTSVPKVCAQGEYLDVSTVAAGVCTACSFTMSGCAKCDSKDTCLLCTGQGTTAWRTKNLQTCKYECRAAACATGTDGCFKCATNTAENYCLACKTGFYYNGFTQMCVSSGVTDVCPVPTGQTQGYWFDGSRCLVCDANCKTCATSATKCTACNDGYVIAVDKCNVAPAPGNGTGTGNQTTQTGASGTTTPAESSSLWKWILIGGVVLLLLAVVGGVVFFVMNKEEDERDEESEHEEELDTRRDDNYELTETKMDHHTMDQDMDH